MPASAGSASSSPATGARAHGVNTGGAASISPNRANTRSAPRSTGSVNTGACTATDAVTATEVVAEQSDCCPDTEPQPDTGSGSGSGSGWRKPSEPAGTSAVRTLPCDTPTSAATAR